MKKLIITILTSALVPISVNAMSCLTVENGKKTLCNDYSNLKNKDPIKLKKLCSSGDLNMAGMKIIGEFSNKGCDHTGALAKCRLRDFDTTMYFSGDLKDMEKGCKVFKAAEFIKL